jgi:hypothetical protein
MKIFKDKIHNAAELIEFISRIGFLPLLDSGIAGFSAEEIVDEECRYVVFPDSGWDWPLWKWKGEVITEGGHVYGKFYAGKAGFISREWWPDFCNYRSNIHPAPAEGSIEDTILQTLAEHGSLITRELRALCGFDGPKMRSRFDSYVTRLQMATRIVTEDFVYPRDKHNRKYGWGWSLLTTPERLYGHDANHCNRSPEESIRRICQHLRQICPEATEKQLLRIVK